MATSILNVSAKEKVDALYGCAAISGKPLGSLLPQRQETVVDNSEEQTAWGGEG